MRGMCGEFRRFEISTCLSLNEEKRAYIKYMAKPNLPFVTKMSGKSTRRFYEAPCPGCGKIRLKLASRIHHKCRSCATINALERFGGKMRNYPDWYRCIWTGCQREITKPNSYCKIHRMVSVDSHKYYSHQKVRSAIRAGKLKKLPCEKCGIQEDVHGHHSDYKKPLDVTWLCRPHHLEAHGGRYGSTPTQQRA